MAKAKSAPTTDALVDRLCDPETQQADLVTERVEREVLNPEFTIAPFRVTELTLDLDTPETVCVYGEYLHNPSGSILELEPEHAASDAMELIEDETGFSVKSISVEPYTYA
jgi:hypothetical protein